MTGASFASLSRALAVGHFLWAAALGIAAVWVAWMLLSILPHMSTGNVWTNVLYVSIMAAFWSLPLAALGFWLSTLGRDLWSLRRDRRRPILVTHTALLVFGTLSITLGNGLFRAADESAKRGGGLMGGLGVYPLAFGTFVLLIALPSLAALVLVPGPGRGEETLSELDTR